MTGKKTWILKFLVVVLLTGCGIGQGYGADDTPTPKPVLTITPLNDAKVLPMGKRPNFLVILTDDLDAEMGTTEYMPHLQELLVKHGLSFDEFFISTPLCCPARATFLRGQYVHNHGIYRNDQPFGGFEEFYYLQNESSTLGTWLQAAGYRTALLGKYFNGYPIPSNQTYVPIGWTDWYSSVKGQPFAGYKYTLNENGVLVRYDDPGSEISLYMTDVLARKANGIIEQAAASNTPFFVYINTYTPHVPVKPAKRHENLFADIKIPRSDSFNEEDVTDKPPAFHITPLLTQPEITKLDEEYRARVQAMQATDEMIELLIGTLEKTGELENTYIIFSSDNGYHLGQHRLSHGKGYPYEEDIRVPFIVRGPGVEDGKHLSGYITGNLDFAPTVAELAGVVPPEYVDGRSMVSLLNSERPSRDQWRSAYFLEFYGYNLGDTETEDAQSPAANYFGIRTDKYLYVEYGDGFVELYNMLDDPHQLENIASVAEPSLLKMLSDWLKKLSTCSSAQCRLADMKPTEQ